MFGTQPHSIEIVINADGTLESTVGGVAGPTCHELTQWLEQLGNVVEDRSTPEFYQVETLGNTLTTGV